MRLSLIEYFLFPKATFCSSFLSKTIAGKTIVITGASYGIGAQLAELFSRHKVHLVLIARTTERLEAIAQKANDNGSNCIIISADLYQESEVDKVIASLKALPNGIDFFISNAGKSIMRSLSDSLDRYHDFTRTNSLNYLSPVKMILALTPLLQKNKGQLLNVSAINVLLLPAPKWAAYQASKTAFDQWFRSNQAEWNLMGIKTQTIYLPLVRTKMIAPNILYQNYPAMTPEQAAIRIAKLISSSKSYTKPWWTVFPQWIGFLGRTLWERLTFCYLKKKK